jgi:spore coat polysaccharide biosynthesis predicted glycosyltransferase SpsG
MVEYPDADTVLAGPSYCMLRSEFRDRSTQRPDDSQQEGLAVLLTIGGADLKNSFESILETTTRVVPDEATIHAIVGPYFDDSSRDGVEFHRTPSNLATLMARCDLAVSGGGQTLYELAVCGTPPVAVRLGDDQVRNITRFAAEGFCVDAGWPDDAEFSSRLRRGLTELTQPDQRSRRAHIGRSLVDRNGVIRVADALIEHLSD